ncbi:hypothetical protein EDD21DRAFT_408870 [Dissophora ornata]|nr:hypothetical protein EDD21DRAFT_408870 [Dissophora ornata]
MAKSSLRLFCLVDGDTISRAFSVIASSGSTVDQLRDLIKAKQTVALSDVNASELMLWHVSVLITDDGQDFPILQDALNPNKPRPTSKLSSVFGKHVPEDSIHIIVQRPPPAQSPPFSYYFSQKRPFSQELEFAGQQKKSVLSKAGSNTRLQMGRLSICLLLGSTCSRALNLYLNPEQYFIISRTIFKLVTTSQCQVWAKAPRSLDVTATTLASFSLRNKCWNFGRIFMATKSSSSPPTPYS